MPWRRLLDKRDRSSGLGIAEAGECRRELAEQTVGGIKRISGFVRARHFITIIDSLDLEANPRSSKIGRVTNAIIDSIETTPQEFTFKTKGVLLGATKFELLDRGRVRAVFQERDKDGILDGGHNTLAIGLHILKIAGVPDARIRKARDWATFRDLWSNFEKEVKAFRGALSGFGTKEPVDDELSFLIPVELIVPSDLDDLGIVDQFQSSILEICAARNNNAELVVSAKSNQAGFYDDLKSLLPADIASRIEWKVGDGPSRSRRATLRQSEAISAKCLRAEDQSSPSHTASSLGYATRPARDTGLPSPTIAFGMAGTRRAPTPN